MKIREFFTGSLQEKEARKTIKGLRALPKLNSRKQNRLTEALRLRRRYFIRLSVMFLLPLLVLVLAATSAYPNYRFNCRKRTVDESVKKVMAGLPSLDLKATESRMKKEPTALNHLTLLKAFYDSVSWAEIKDGGEIISMSNGYTNGVWIAFYQDDKRAQAQAYTLSIARENPNILTIKSTNFQSDWFGIFLVHEISHLFDYATGIEPANPNRLQYINGEAVAYLSEKELLNYYTKGKFDQAITNFIQLHQLNNLDQAKTFWQKLRFDNSAYDAMTAFFTQALSMPQPQNREEEGLCMFLFQVSVTFRIIDHTYPDRDNLDKYREYLETIYSSQLNGIQ